VPAAFDSYCALSHTVCEAHTRFDDGVGAFVSYCVEVQTDATSHCVDPACGWNWDAPLQLLQAPAPSASAYLPTAQLVQLWPMPAGLNWPAGQATQLPASEPPHAV
jgi:hypothetical protein